MKIKILSSSMLKNGSFSVSSGLLELLQKNNLVVKSITFSEISNQCSHTQTLFMSTLLTKKRKIGLLGKRNCKPTGNLLIRNSIRLTYQLLTLLETDTLYNHYLITVLKYYLLVTLVSVKPSLLRVSYLLLILTCITLLLTSQLVLHQKIPKRLLRLTSREEPKISIDLRMPNKRPFALLMILTCQERTLMVHNHHQNSLDNGWIMVSGMTDKKSSKIKSVICKFFQLWVNQVVVELKFQRDFNLSSTL